MWGLWSDSRSTSRSVRCVLVVLVFVFTLRRKIERHVADHFFPFFSLQLPSFPLPSLQGVFVWGWCSVGGAFLPPGHPWCFVMKNDCPPRACWTLVPEVDPVQQEDVAETWGSRAAAGAVCPRLWSAGSPWRLPCLACGVQLDATCRDGSTFALASGHDWVESLHVVVCPVR